MTYIGYSDRQRTLAPYSSKQSHRGNPGTRFRSAPRRRLSPWSILRQAARCVAAVIGLAWLVLQPTAAVSAEVGVRTKMLLEAGIDGYKTDDDATAIGRYLTAVGDRKRAVSADIADWIITRIHDFSGEATPQLLSGYMHFLRADVKAAPFSVGPTGSPRRRLLLAIEQDLVAYDTPLTDFALLFFLESDDAELVQVAQSTGFRNLKRFPWQIGGDEWTNWATIGLNPDVANSNISVQDPE